MLAAFNETKTNFLLNSHKRRDTTSKYIPKQSKWRKCLCINISDYTFKNGLWIKYMNVIVKTVPLTNKFKYESPVTFIFRRFDLL